MIIITVSLLTAFIFIITGFQKKIQFTLSDHYFHIGLIEGIKKNRHKFVSEHPNFIVEDNFGYPQLYHFILSFLPSKFYLKYFFWLNMFFNWILIIVVFVFSIYLLRFDRNPFSEIISLNVIIVTALTPFLYLPWNAKNMGISPRNIGFITVTSLNFALLTFKLEPTYGHATWIVLSICLIILSSQMAHQYVILGLIPVSIVITPLFFLFYLWAVLVCFLIAPKVMRKYFVGQFWHKYIFYKYLMNEYVFCARESIWLDFPVVFYHKFEMNFKQGIMYFYSNPVLLIFWAIPYMIPAYYFGIQKNDEFSNLLINFNSIGLLLFFLTSFRITRFLGEPERYVEFFIPTLSLQLFYSVPVGVSDYWMVSLCIYGALAIIILFWIQYRSVGKTSSKWQKNMDEMFSVFLPEINDDKSLISNSWHVMRRFYGTDIKTFTPNFTSLKTGIIPLTTFFKDSFIYLDADCLGPISENYKVCYCIIDTNVTGADKWEEKLEGYRNILNINHFKLYKKVSLRDF